jgi:hypothetical protein
MVFQMTDFHIAMVVIAFAAVALSFIAGFSLCNWLVVRSDREASRATVTRDYSSLLAENHRLDGGTYKKMPDFATCTFFDMGVGGMVARREGKEVK